MRNVCVFIFFLDDHTLCETPCLMNADNMCGSEDYWIIHDNTEKQSPLQATNSKVPKITNTTNGNTTLLNDTNIIVTKAIFYPMFLKDNQINFKLFTLAMEVCANQSLSKR